MSRASPHELRRPRMRHERDMTSRKQLVAWINHRLGSTYSGFEDLQSGEDYCKLLDMLRPGSLSLAKVRSGAKLEGDRMRNFKLLQQGLETAGLHKKFSIERLMEGHFREHFELVKWLKKLFDGLQRGGNNSSSAADAADIAKEGQGDAEKAGAGPESEKELNIDELFNVKKQCDTYRSVLLSIDSLCRKYKAAEHEDARLADKILEHLDALDLKQQAAGDGPAED